MPTELVNLNLEELSLVDKGANQFAKAPIFKADTSNGDHNKMTDEVIKMSEEMDKKIKEYMKAKGCDRKTAEEAMMKSLDVTEEVETLKEQNENLRKALLDEGYKITKEGIEKKAPEEFIEYGGEKVNKADIPAPILKALEEAELEKADTALTKRAETELPHFSVDVAKSLITAVEKMDDAEALFEALMAADKAFEDKMQELGKSDADGEFASANDKMDALVKAHMESKEMKKSDYAKAYAEVAKTDEGREVLKAIRKGE